MRFKEAVSPEVVLSAARAEMIPSAWSGAWCVQKATLKEESVTEKGLLPAGTYTHLFRLTDSTLYNSPPGEVVMEDTPYELRTHLDFMIRAYGRVLVTGLGLGCVVRGLLANPAVEHVTCIENSPDVLKLVRPYMPTERLSIIEAEALTWTAESGQSFDCAWHDLWADRDAGQPHLDNWHMRLMFNCAKQVEFQGAWSFNRTFKRLLQTKGLNLI